MKCALEAKGISKKFQSGMQEVNVLKKVDFAVCEGEIVVIIGKSGSGKSTFLNVVGGLLKPEEGEVYLDGESLYDKKEGERTKMRSKRIGFIFQNFNLVNELSVLNNIRLPFDIAKMAYEKEDEKEIIDMLGIQERLLFYPEQLSGGERQRVAIARALLVRPSIILADEPTGNLDFEAGKKLMEFVERTNRERKQSYIIVTHDLEWEKIAHKVFQMIDGELVRR